MGHNAILSIIDGMACNINFFLNNLKRNNAILIGIRTGGVLVAKELYKRLKFKNFQSSLGILDISFYRDDFSCIGLNPRVKPSVISFNINNQHIILVDDVVHTGRTIRAALNEIFDYGRPASVALVTLVERSGRELPIEPVIIGVKVTLQPSEQVKLNGPKPMELVIGSDH